MHIALRFTAGITPAPGLKDVVRLSLFLTSSKSNRSIQHINLLFTRSSHPDVFFKTGVLRNFAKLTEKHLCQSLYFNKVAGPRPATFLRQRFWRRCFPVNLAIFLRTPFLKNTSGGCFSLSFKTLNQIGRLNIKQLEPL